MAVLPSHLVGGYVEAQWREQAWEITNTVANNEAAMGLPRPLLPLLAYGWCWACEGTLGRG